jgi:MFS family permease
MGVGGQWAASVVLAMEMCEGVHCQALVSAIVQGGFGLGMQAAASLGTHLDDHARGWGYALLSPLCLLPLSLLLLLACPRSCKHEGVKAAGELSVHPCGETVKSQPGALLHGMVVLAIESMALSASCHGWSRAVSHEPPACTGTPSIRSALFLYLGAFTVVCGFVGDRVVREQRLYAAGALATGLVACAWMWVGPPQGGGQKAAYALSFAAAMGMLEVCVCVRVCVTCDGGSCASVPMCRAGWGPLNDPPSDHPHD